MNCFTGSFRTENEGDPPVTLYAGDIHVVPAGTRRRPAAKGFRLFAAIPRARLVKIAARDHLTVVPDQRFKEEVVHFLKSCGH